MSAGVCVQCFEIADGGALCAKCGGRLSRTKRDWTAREEKLNARRIARWMDEGLIDDDLAAKLLERSSPSTEETNEQSEEKAGERGVEVIADKVAGDVGSFFHEMGDRWKKVTRAIEEDAPPSKKSDPPEPIAHEDRGPRKAAEQSEGTVDYATEAGRQVFARGDASVVGPGVDALSALDDVAEPTAEPMKLGALQVFWFIGTILVLAGSVMGVREAWRTLEGVWRPVVIAAAMFGYHVLFVGLARLLAKRSATTGRVLAVIAAGLLPIVFVAAAVAIGQQRSIGLPFAIVLLLASMASMFVAGRSAAPGALGAGPALAMGLAPALVLELVIGGGGATTPRRGLVVLLGLVPAFVAATRARIAISASSVVALAAAAYGALAVGILGLYGGPGDPVLAPDADPVAQAALVAWLACGATVAWWATSGGAFLARYPRVGIVPVVVSLAVLVGTSAAALVTGLSRDPTSIEPGEALALRGSLAVLLLATAVLAWEQRARRGAIHVGILVALAAALSAARIAAPDRPELWAPACAAVPAFAFAAAGSIGEARRRRSLATWAIVTGLVTLLVVVLVENGTRVFDAPPAPFWLTATTGLGLGLAAHAGARTTRPSQHLAGAVFAFFGACAWHVPSRAPFAAGDPSWPQAMMTVAAVLAAIYGLAAFGYAAVAPKDDDRRPLDDASLLVATFTTWLGVLVAPSAPSLASTIAITTDVRIAYALPAALLAVVLLLRALRDKSALVVLQASVAIALALQLALGASSPQQGAWLAGCVAAAFAVFAAFRAPRPDSAPKFGRALFGLVPLPLSGGLRTLLDGFAIASVVASIAACLFAFASLGSFGNGNELARTVVLMGLGGVLCVAVAAFVTRAFDRFQARGNVVTLWIAGPIIGLTAVAYRVGRPLPPAVVGFRLTLVIAAVWLLARLFVKIGPRIARGLERPGHGDRYHHVVHAGVVALALLLFVDAVLVGGPTPTRGLVVVPPLLLAGTSLGFLLLYRSYGREPLLHLGVLAFGSATMIAVAHGHLTGPELVPLDPPGGRWVPPATMQTSIVDWLDPVRFIAAPDSELAVWNRGWQGLAAAASIVAAILVTTTRVPAAARFVRATLFARADAEQREIERGLAIPLCILTLLVSAGLAWQPTLPAAALLLLAAVLAVLALAPDVRVLPIVVALPILIHALAHQTDFVPPWAGPAFATLSLAAVVGGGMAAGKMDRDVRILAASQLGALLYAPIAIAYALAADGAVSRTEAAPRILDLAANASDVLWIRTYALPLTFVVLAMAAFVTALQWRGALAKVAAIAPPLVLAIAAGAGVLAFVSDFTGNALALVFTREGAMLGAGIAGAALVAHVTAFVCSRRGREDVVAGLSLGRDVVLVASALVMSFWVAARVPGGHEPGPWGIAALGMAVIVSLHAISWQGTARHVALVEALLVAFYAFATRSLNLRPEIDAMIGLLYGFSLLGVAVVARRRGVPKVADATRRFAAVLPLALAFLTTNGATNEAAALALGSSVLYGAMAWVEHSRILGTLAAVAANLALLVFAIAQGLDGIEVYVGPLGILVTALAQIFAPKTSPAARSALRIIGGALLYLPAGVKLTLRLGAAEDGTYSVVFGAVCLIGVVAGLVMRVRAYLALGTLFLVLDVIANLVYAGLRDHRIGFVLLSATGLSILGIMILVTLRRDRAWALVGRLRERVRAWD